MFSQFLLLKKYKYTLQLEKGRLPKKKDITKREIITVLQAVNLKLKTQDIIMVDKEMKPCTSHE